MKPYFPYFAKYKLIFSHISQADLTSESKTRAFLESIEDKWASEEAHQPHIAACPTHSYTNRNRGPK